MAGNRESPRILVVDDAADMREVIRRVLSASGFRVDTTGTLAEARSMAPGGYDLVLIDMHLGPERGTTLIGELVAADPGFAGRCLIMSGNLKDVPGEVASLPKPFLPGQLLDAVRALLGSSAGGIHPRAPARRVTAPRVTAPGGIPRQGGKRARPAGRRDGAPVPPRETGAGGGAGAAATLLGLSELLRERERSSFADALHDGPVQDLGAAVLGLHLVRDQLPAGETDLLDAVIEQVNAAAQALRALMGRCSPAWQAAPPPAQAIADRTSWLLAAPAAVDVQSPATQLSPQLARFAASVAELVVFLASDTGTTTLFRSNGGPPRARIRVVDADQTTDIEATVRWPAGDPLPADAEVARRESLLRELGTALGTPVDLLSLLGELGVRVSLPRRP